MELVIELILNMLLDASNDRQCQADVQISNIISQDIRRVTNFDVPAPHKIPVDMIITNTMSGDHFQLISSSVKKFFVHFIMGQNEESIFANNALQKFLASHSPWFGTDLNIANFGQSRNGIGVMIAPGH